MHAAHTWGTGLNPQVPIGDKKMYPIYAKCVELDIPMIVYAGVPGPRIPMYPQTVDQLDEICWFFPELKLIVRHGAEPWTALMVKLLLKWPNLYYSTSAFAPKHYPPDIINYANTRGADKVMYAGYYAAGPHVRPHLRGDARRAVPRPRLAQVPARERAAGLRALGLLDDLGLKGAAWGHSKASRSSRSRTSVRCSSRACCSPTSARRCCASTARATRRNGTTVGGQSFVSPYSVLDRGRRSAAIDLKAPGAAEVVLRLCEQADVLIEGFRPGVAERLGDRTRCRAARAIRASSTAA